MATVVLSAVGGAIGGQIGGSVLGLSTAAIGRFAGAMIGRSLDQRTMGRGSEVVETGRVRRLRLTGAGEGDAIARIYGRMRVSGQVIWATEFREWVKITEGSGGGGGGGGGGKGRRSAPAPVTPTVREYKYAVSLAIALCEGEISQVGRVWADGNELTRDNLDMRVYYGTCDQLPDPKIEAVEGAGTVPAYRGTAYVVIENLELEQFGNRVPQFSFEVLRPPQKGQPGAELDPPQAVRGVAMLPGSGEYTLATSKVTLRYGPGSSKQANVNSWSGKSDFLTSMDALEGELPACDAVSLVVSWFGNDLRCGACSVLPKVEQNSFDGANMPWNVSGVRRSFALRVVRGTDNKPLYGGTPSDQAVIEAIKRLKAAGKDVMFYPFILMDQIAGNKLPDPYSDRDHQPELPWRGRITLNEAPGRPGSSDGTNGAEAEVAAFFGTAQASHFATNGTATVGGTGGFAGLINLDWSAKLSPVVYSGPGEWGFRRFILHQAALCKAAGGVESFCIGSEMRGLTQIRGAGNSFPAVQELRNLAAEVRALLGPSTKISYAADWSEYFGYKPQDGSGDRFFNLDPLWADANIDFIGIDNYMPLSDWRDGTEHADVNWETAYDLGYLQANIEGGEGYDWYYTSPEARAAQNRTPITDEAHEESWIWRYKDLRGFWENTHHERVNGVRSEVPTDWVPESKPIRFTEYGCAAVNKGTNQPNKFLDPKSSESKLPYYSDGRRDETIQMQYLRAMNGYWRQSKRNPTSELYGGPMVDMDHAYVWAWDARPYPFFPNNRKLWNDGENYGRGHWISGRAASRRLASVVDEIAEEVGAGHVDTSKLHGMVKGYQVDEIGEARAALQPLMLHYGFDAIERDGTLQFRMRDGVADFEIDPDMVVRDARDEGVLEYTRGSAAELSGRVRLRFVEADGDFEVVAEEAILADDPNPVVSASEFPLSMPRAEGRQTVERWLSEAQLNTDTVQFSLPPSQLEIGAGDVVALPEDGGQGLYRVDRVEERGGTQQLDGVRIDAESYRPVDFVDAVPNLAGFVPPAPVSPFFLDLPLLTGDEVPHAPYLAVAADPWPGSAALYASDFDSNYRLNTVASARTPIGITETELSWAPSGLMDRSDGLLVKMLHGELESVSEAAILNGANLCAIGNGSPDGWELFQFETADMVGPETYMLSKRLRGQLGTERTEGYSWPVGSYIVRMDGSPLQIDLPDAKRGLSRFYRIGPAGRPLDDPAYQQIELAFEGIGLRPYRPVHLRLQGAVGQDRLFSWVRRGRIGADRWETPEIPLGEEREQYIVRVVRAGETLREELADTAEWVYSAAAQSADSFTLGDELQVAQVSSLFGAGVSARYINSA
ncbi:glycoside hydrolase/phage tail family protein [Roseovarius sp. EL26]|uniref:baseplate multidomain protein megatron n=1 Tax=Roseovarius sp. EL26 TaxID=2126672 RepID=UPI000EA162A8|nr:glycoside hydrolase/phage tail family protein [Roseovarius sp. EL26]